MLAEVEGNETVRKFCGRSGQRRASTDVSDSKTVPTIRFLAVDAISSKVTVVVSWRWLVQAHESPSLYF